MTSSQRGLPALTMSRDEAEQLLQKRVTEGGAMGARAMSTQGDLDAARHDQTQWVRYNADLLRRMFGGDEVLNSLFATWGSAISMPRTLSSAIDVFRGDIKRQVGDLEGLIQRLPLYPEPSKPQANQDEEADAIAVLTRLCDRFHIVVRQLQKRHNGRQTIPVNDEYDVQDIMHSLLRLHFDDIRDEEVTPSYAGKSSRMDFLLREPSVVLETKMTRPGLDEKRLGSELIEDKERYRKRGGCRTLVCFVYDPEGRIANPRGVEADLSESDVHVFIRPR